MGVSCSRYRVCLATPPAAATQRRNRKRKRPVDPESLPGKTRTRSRLPVDGPTSSGDPDLGRDHPAATGTYYSAGTPGREAPPARRATRPPRIVIGGRKNAVAGLDAAQTPSGPASRHGIKGKNRWQATPCQETPPGCGPPPDPHMERNHGASMRPIVLLVFGSLAITLAVEVAGSRRVRGQSPVRRTDRAIPETEPLRRCAAQRAGCALPEAVRIRSRGAGRCVPRRTGHPAHVSLLRHGCRPAKRGPRRSTWRPNRSLPTTTTASPTWLVSSSACSRS